MGAFDELKKTQLFQRNIDVYTNAPLIGFLYGRMADKDFKKNPTTGEAYSQSIMDRQIIQASSELRFNFWLIMLLDKNYEPDEEKRITKAFREYGKNPEDAERFDSYARGGVDVLYENLIEGANEPGDFAERLYEFLDDFNDKFNKTINRDEIFKLCYTK